MISQCQDFAGRSLGKCIVRRPGTVVATTYWPASKRRRLTDRLQSLQAAVQEAPHEVDKPALLFTEHLSSGEAGLPAVQLLL